MNDALETIAYYLFAAVIAVAGFLVICAGMLGWLAFPWMGYDMAGWEGFAWGILLWLPFGAGTVAIMDKCE